MKARGLVRLVRGVWAGWAAALLIACDAPTAPSEIETPATPAPGACKGYRKHEPGCGVPIVTLPPLEALFIYPPMVQVGIEGVSVGIDGTTPLWLIGYYGERAWICAVDASGFPIGRFAVDEAHLYASAEAPYLPNSAPAPQPTDPGEFVADDRICWIGLTIDDPDVAWWIPPVWMQNAVQLAAAWGRYASGVT